MKSIGKNHVVDYISIFLLISLLFFTIFSSSYLSSKKTVSTQAWEEGEWQPVEFNTNIDPETVPSGGTEDTWSTFENVTTQFDPCVGSCVGKCGGEDDGCGGKCWVDCPTSGTTGNTGTTDNTSAPEYAGTPANGTTGKTTCVSDTDCTGGTTCSNGACMSRATGSGTTATKEDPIAKQIASTLSGALGNLLKGGATGSQNSSGQQPSYSSGYVSPTPRVVTPTPINTQNRLESTGGVDVNLFMKLKFQGITKKPKDELDDIRAKVTLVDTTTGRSAVSYGNFVADENGNWLGEVPFKNITPRDGYQILVKGPQHMQRKLCINAPTESSVGGYKCSGTIELVEGDNGIDASGVYLLSGDVGNQDGVANSYDLGNVKTRFGKQDMASLNFADINHDGVINSLDYSLVLQSLLAVADTDEK